MYSSQGAPDIFRIAADAYKLTVFYQMRKIKGRNIA